MKRCRESNGFQKTTETCAQNGRVKECSYKILQAADKPVDCEQVAATARAQAKAFKKICCTKLKRLVVRPFLKISIKILKAVVKAKVGVLRLLLLPFKIVVKTAKLLVGSVKIALELLSRKVNRALGADAASAADARGRISIRAFLR